MALDKQLKGLRPAGSSYWIVDGYRYDKNLGQTKISLAGYESREVRLVTFPAADDRFSIDVDGTVTGLAQCYELAKGDGQQLENAKDA